MVESNILPSIDDSKNPENKVPTIVPVQDKIYKSERRTKNNLQAYITNLTATKHKRSDFTSFFEWNPHSQKRT